MMALKGYRPFQRRREATLIRWWDELNGWGWPKEIEKVTGEADPGKSCSELRSSVMDKILHEIGLRQIFKAPLSVRKRGRQ